MSRCFKEAYGEDWYNWALHGNMRLIRPLGKRQITDTTELYERLQSMR